MQFICSLIHLDNLQVNLRYIFQSGMNGPEDVERVLQRGTFALYQNKI